MADDSDSDQLPYHAHKHIENQALLKTDLDEPLTDPYASMKLGDPIVDMDADERYKFNYKIILPLLISLILWIPEVLEKNLQRNMDIYKMVTFTIMFIICIIMLIYARFGKQSYIDNLQSIFNISSTKSSGSYIYDITEYRLTTVILLCGWLYASIMNMIMFGLSLLDCRYDDRTQCLVFWSTWAESLPLTFSFVYFSFLMLVTPQCKQKIAEEKQLLLSKYRQSPCIQKMDQCVIKSLEKWRDRKSLRNNKRKLEIVVTFIIFFIIFLLIRGVVQNNMFSSEYQIGLIIICVFLTAIDAMFLALTLVWGHTMILHSRFPSLIMQQLSNPINATSIMDVTGWWELRNYYNYCVIRVHSYLLEFAVGVVLLCSLYLMGMCFVLLKQSKTAEDEEADVFGYAPLLYLFFPAAFYIIVGTFMVVENVVWYHRYQVNHAKMMNREILQLNTRRLRTLSEDEYRIPKEDKVIESILLDINENSNALSVLGVRINDNFLIFLRATTITVFVGLLIGNA